MLPRDDSRAQPRGAPVDTVAFPLNGRGPHPQTLTGMRKREDLEIERQKIVAEIEQITNQQKRSR